MSPSRRGSVWAAAVVLAGVGGVLLGTGLSSPGAPPQPTAAQADQNPVTSAPSGVVTTMTVTRNASGEDSADAGSPEPSTPGSLTTAASTSSAAGGSAPAPARIAGSTESNALVLSASVPISISIPAIGVQSQLLQLGLNPNRTIEVPPLDEPLSRAGWYKYSPTPGQIGPTVILGHVDSKRHGPAVFYELGALQKGAAVEVTRPDRTVAVFTVEKVVAYQKSDFPSAAVYGDIDYPGLRLITCGGTFDPDAGSYEGSVVAYARLTSTRPAG